MDIIELEQQIKDLISQREAHYQIASSLTDQVIKSRRQVEEIKKSIRDLKFQSVKDRLKNLRWDLNICSMLEFRMASPHGFEDPIFSDIYDSRENNTTPEGFQYIIENHKFVFFIKLNALQSLLKEYKIPQNSINFSDELSTIVEQANNILRESNG